MSTKLEHHQTFDPPIYGYIVKIVPEKCEELIWQFCVILTTMLRKYHVMFHLMALSNTKNLTILKPTFFLT